MFLNDKKYITGSMVNTKTVIPKKIFFTLLAQLQIIMYLKIFILILIELQMIYFLKLSGVLNIQNIIK